jgi:hypothetical protein
MEFHICGSSRTLVLCPWTFTLRITSELRSSGRAWVRVSRISRSALPNCRSHRVGQHHQRFRHHRSRSLPLFLYGTRSMLVRMRKPATVRSTEAFTRARLSESFFMRDFLYSEIAAIHGMNNLPDDPDLAIAAGRGLCENLLEPLQRTFGRLAIRSAYRSPQVNAFGNAHFQSCGSNEGNRARHIWDQRSDDGGMGAMTTVVVPWLVDRLTRGVTWHAMAWWIHDHLPYSELQFFPKLAAFNIGWHEIPRRRISSFLPPRGILTKPGLPGHDGNHSDQYAGFPKLVSVPRSRFTTARGTASI